MQTLSLDKFYAEMNAEIARRELQYMTHYYPEAVMETFRKGGTPAEAARGMHQTWFWRNGGSGQSPYWKE